MPSSNTYYTTNQPKSQAQHARSSKPEFRQLLPFHEILHIRLGNLTVRAVVLHQATHGCHTPPGLAGILRSLRVDLLYFRDNGQRPLRRRKRRLVVPILPFLQNRELVACQRFFLLLFHNVIFIGRRAGSRSTPPSYAMLAPASTPNPHFFRAPHRFSRQVGHTVGFHQGKMPDCVRVRVREGRRGRRFFCSRRIICLTFGVVCATRFTARYRMQTACFRFMGWYFWTNTLFII